MLKVFLEKYFYLKLILDTIYTGSLAEERSLPVYFWPNFLYMYRDKVYSNEHSHWFKLHMASAVYLGVRWRGGEGKGEGGGRGGGKGGEGRSTASSAMHIGGKELSVTLF